MSLPKTKVDVIERYVEEEKVVTIYAWQYENLWVAYASIDHVIKPKNYYGPIDVFPAKDNHSSKAVAVKEAKLKASDYIKSSNKRF